MNRCISALLALLMLMPCFSYAATPALPPTGPQYVVLIPEEVAANALLLQDYYAYPVPMGMEAGPLKAPLAPKADMPVLGVPPLVWGILLSIPGVIVVRLNSQERSATQKALLGAGINLAALTILYFTVLSPVTKSK